MSRLGLVAVLVGLGCPAEEDDRTPTATLTSTSATPTTSDASSGATAESSDSGDTVPLPENACTDAHECRLLDDCCSCVALHIDEAAPACDQTCERTLCESWGITEILCSHTCHVRLVECDAGLVECADAPPDCDDGFVPSIDKRCWTRHCVPLELCTP